MKKCVLGWVIVGVMGVAFFVPTFSYAVCGGSSPNLTAASAGYTDVNDCLTAAVDGDTITVPAGSATWTSKLTWTNKSITLKGAGIGQTIIYSDVTGAYPCLINLTAKATGNSPAGFTRITGFDFRPGANCGDNTPDTTNGLIHVQGLTDQFRFDHNRVESSDISVGVVFLGYIRGVVDHNELTNSSTSANRKSFTSFHTKWLNTGSYGDQSWASASTVGTLDILMFEDNVFDRGTGNFGTNAATDDYQGSRTAYRFNTFNDYYLATHGTETGGRQRGFRHLEAYRNSFSWSYANTLESMIGLRGGTGMIFDNTVTQDKAPRWGALNTLRREDDGSHNTGWYPWGACGLQGAVSSVTRSGSTVTVTTSAEHYVHASGSKITISGANEADYNGTFTATRVNSTSFTYTIAGTPTTPATGTITYASPFDQNADATGYHCLDQVGYGAGQLYSGDGPPTISPVSSNNQTLEPVYCFNNLIAGNLRGCEVTYAADTTVENREFYNQQGSFDGTVGIGRGLRSARPATCTTGTAYWSTDGGGNWNTVGEDGGLDLCSATNTWTNDWYVPPTYPHPLNAPAVVPPAITCTGQSFGFNVPGDPQAQDYTVPSVTNGITLIGLSWRSQTRTLSSITIGGLTPTEIGTRVDSPSNVALQVFYRRNMTAGVHSVNADWNTAPLSYVLTVATCGGVDQITPISATNTATGNSTAITVDCTSAVGQVVVDFPAIDADGPMTEGASQTVLGQNEADNTLAAGASTEAGAATTTMSWTANTGDWATRCVALTLASSGRRQIAPFNFQ